MKTIVALPGEGIGIEVIDATCEVLVGTGLPLKILTPPQGAAATKSHGTPLPDETKRAAREADGVLFGAAGPATSPVVSWLRWEMDALAGVRPIRYYTGMHSPLADPEGIDYVLLRENSEGIYPGREGDLADMYAADAGAQRPDRPHHQRLRQRGTLRGQGRHAARRRADRALRLRAGPQPQGPGQARQGDVRDQVQRAAQDRRAVPGDRRARGARGRASTSSTSTWTTPRAGWCASPSRWTSCCA